MLGRERKNPNSMRLPKIFEGEFGRRCYSQKKAIEGNFLNTYYWVFLRLAYFGLFVAIILKPLAE